MSERVSDQTPLRSSSHNLSQSQPYTLPQALRRLGNGPTRTGTIKDRVLQGFPYNNASPRLAAATPTVLATDARPGDTLTRAAAEGQGPRRNQHQQQQQRPVFRRQRSGGLFIEASDPSPPLGSSHQPSAGPDTVVPPRRGLFHTGEEHGSYLEEELSSRGIVKWTGRMDPTYPADRMSDKDATVFDQQESYEKVTRGQKAKRHCARWWWVYLIILVCIIVLVVCLVIFVGIPRIAQSRVNAAELSIEGITLSQTQADNFTLSINSTLRADSSIGAVFDPFDAVMYLEDWAPQTPYARVRFPQTTSASETLVNITQFTEILDQNAFVVFNTWFLLNESINLSVEGDTHVKVSGISKKFPVHFKKTMNMPGLGNLNGTTVPESRVSLTSDAQGDNFFGTVTIPNRSLIGLEMGNVSFINYMLGEETVGTVFIDNMILAPGLNNYSMRANITQPPVLDAIQQRPYCESGVLPFQLQGSDVTNHGQYLPYFAVPLGSTNQSVDIDVGAALSALGLTIQCSNTTSTKRSMELL